MIEWEKRPNEASSFSTKLKGSLDGFNLYAEISPTEHEMSVDLYLRLSDSNGEYLSGVVAGVDMKIEQEEGEKGVRKLVARLTWPEKLRQIPVSGEGLDIMWAGVGTGTSDYSWELMHLAVWMLGNTGIDEVVVKNVWPELKGDVLFNDLSSEGLSLLAEEWLVESDGRRTRFLEQGEVEIEELRVEINSTLPPPEGDRDYDEIVGVVFSSRGEEVIADGYLKLTEDGEWVFYLEVLEEFKSDYKTLGKDDKTMEETWQEEKWGWGDDVGVKFMEDATGSLWALFVRYLQSQYEGVTIIDNREGKKEEMDLGGLFEKSEQLLGF